MFSAAYSFYGLKVEANVKREGLTLGCGPDAPIMVIVHNYTFHRLARATLTLEGWRDGRSRDILSHRLFYFDAVTGPFSTSAQCFPDAAFALTKDEDRTSSHEETEEERKVRIQKMVDTLREQDRLSKIVADPRATEYDKLDAMDKSLSLDDKIYHPSNIVDHTDVRFDSSKMLAEVAELERLTSGVTIVVKEVEPEFY